MHIGNVEHLLAAGGGRATTEARRSPGRVESGGRPVSATATEGGRLFGDEMGVFSLHVRRAASPLAASLHVWIGGGHVAAVGHSLSVIVLLTHVDSVGE